MGERTQDLVYPLLCIAPENNVELMRLKEESRVVAQMGKFLSLRSYGFQGTLSGGTSP